MMRQIYECDGVVTAALGDKVASRKEQRGADRAGADSWFAEAPDESSASMPSRSAYHDLSSHRIRDKLIQLGWNHEMIESTLAGLEEDGEWAYPETDDSDIKHMGLWLPRREFRIIHFRGMEVGEDGGFL